MTTSNESAMAIPRPTTPILPQKELLLMCLEKRPWLVLLSSRFLDNLECARTAWQEIANELNHCSNGVYKSGEEWAKENKSLLQKENLMTANQLDQEILNLEGIEHFPDANNSPTLSLTDDTEISKEPEDNEAHLPAHPNHCDSEPGSLAIKERVLGPTLLQQEMLVQCLEERPWLVSKNLVSPDSKAAWQKIAKKLNYHRDGVFKSWSKWAQYWVRKKIYVKRRTLLIEKDTRINGSAEDSGFLTSLDKRILKLLQATRSKRSWRHNTAMNESGAKVRILPTSTQQETLVECLEEKPWLAQRKNPMPAESKAAWQEIANNLNRHRNGAVRSWSQWARYAMRKIQYVKYGKTTRSAGDSDFLTSLDKRILKLIHVGNGPELSLQDYVSRAKPPTLQQQEMLVECLEEKPWLVHCLNYRRPELRNSWSAAWQEVAKKLNHHRNGAVKSWEKWIEYLAQRKTYVRKKCLIAQKNRSDGAEDSVLFTSVDHRILKLIHADHLLVGNTGPDLPLEHNAIKEIRPTQRQKDMLLKCLKERPWLPRVTNHTALSRIRANAIWQEMAKKLNSHRIGVRRSWKQWEMLWNEKKRRALFKLRFLKKNPTGVREDSKYRVYLTESDQQVLKMIGVERFPVGNAGLEFSRQDRLSYNNDGNRSCENNPKVNKAMSKPKLYDPLLEFEDDQDLSEPEDDVSLSQLKDNNPLIESVVDDPLLETEDDPLLETEDDPLLETEDDPLLESENDQELLEPEDDESPLQPGNDNNVLQREDYEALLLPEHADPLLQCEDDDPLVQNKADTLTQSKNVSLIQNEDYDSSIQNEGDEAEVITDEPRPEPARPTRRDPGSSATPPRRRRVLPRKRRLLTAEMTERLMAIEKRRVENKTQMIHVMRTMSDAWLQQTRAIQDLATTLQRLY